MITKADFDVYAVLVHVPCYSCAETVCTLYIMCHRCIVWLYCATGNHNTHTMHNIYTTAVCTDAKARSMLCDMQYMLVNCA
jgi:hypothetical protein